MLKRLDRSEKSEIDKKIHLSLISLFEHKLDNNFGTEGVPTPIPYILHASEVYSETYMAKLDIVPSYKDQPGGGKPGCGGRVVTGGAGGESWRWEANAGGERREREGGRLAGEARESFNGVVAMARARGH